MEEKENNSNSVNILFKLDNDLNKVVELVKLRYDITKEEAMNKVIRWYVESDAGRELVKDLTGQK